MTGLLPHAARVLGITLAAAVLSGALMHYAPASTVDSRELNTRLSEQTLARLRTEKQAQANLPRALLQYFSGFVQGDLGYSVSRDASITQLIGEALPQTARLAGLGLAAAWFAALLLSAPVRGNTLARLWRGTSTALSASLLCFPAALLAYFTLAGGGSAVLVLALALAPKLAVYIHGIWGSVLDAPHVDAARCWGISEVRILWRHVVPSALPQLLALAATSVALALGAAIPIETICDIPGLGKLAWQAALSRDLPLLVNLTALAALITTIATAASESFVRAEPGA